MKPAPRVLPIIAWLAYAPLDYLARKIVRVAPIVFDAERHHEWRAMVEAADVWRAPGGIR